MDAKPPFVGAVNRAVTEFVYLGRQNRHDEARRFCPSDAVPHAVHMCLSLSQIRVRTSTPRLHRRILIAASSGALVAGLVAAAPPASASACPSASTTIVTETVNGIARTYTASVVEATGSCQWTVPSTITSVDLLVVGGGGGGGGGVRERGAGGGGGGGQVIETTGQVVPGEVLTVNVGQGGAAGRGGEAGTAGLDAGMAPAGPGTTSSVSGSSITTSAAGGLAGGNGTKTMDELTYSGPGGDSGSGNAGGSPNWDAAGGGAGQGGSGSPGVDISGQGGDGGAGGVGVSSSISGTTKWYGAGGGGGGSYAASSTHQGTGGPGGSGVGGNGNKNNGSGNVGLLPTPGAANSGSGGGGGGGVPISAAWNGAPGWPIESGDTYERVNGAAGASGVVIIRYTNGPNLSGMSTLGAAQVDSVITASGSGITGTPTPTAAYQWQSSPNGISSWSSIAGAIANTFTPASSHVGQFLRAELTLTNPSGSAVAHSAVVGPVLEPSTPPTPTPTPATAPYAPPTPAPVPQENTSRPEVTSPAQTPPNALPVGATSALLAGQPVTVQDQPLPRGQGLSLSAGPVSMTLRSTTPNGRAVPLERDGSLLIARSGDLPITASGLAPGSIVTKTLFSDPITLGITTADNTGVLASTIPIPSTVPLGSHTLRLQGTTNTGDPFTLDMGVTVATPAVALGANPILTVKQATLKGARVVHLRARGVQARCLVTFTANRHQAKARANRTGTARAHITLPNQSKRGVTVTARITGKGCAPVRVNAQG